MPKGNLTTTTFAMGMSATNLCLKIGLTIPAPKSATRLREQALLSDREGNAVPKCHGQWLPVPHG